jgi:hypothetical protein
VRRFAASCAVLLAFCAGAWGQPISGPGEFPEHTIGTYKVATTGQLAIKIPPGLSVHKHADCWCVTGKPGLYEFEGWWVDFDARKIEPVGLTIRITGDNPPEPEPGPGPQPGPADEFTESIKRAYRADLDSKKAESLRGLESLYRTTRPGDYANAGALFLAMKAEANRLGVAGKLPGVQAVIQPELKKYLPTDPAASFDPAMVSGVFGKIADALKEAGK